MSVRERKIGSLFLTLFLIVAGYVTCGCTYLPKQETVLSPFKEYVVPPLACEQHRMQTCGACHAEAGLENAFFTAEVHNSACVKCHAEKTTVHHPKQSMRFEKCTSCHKEHQGDAKLILDDRLCFSCHRSDAALKGTGIFKSVPSLSTHPEIRLHRIDAPRPVAPSAAPVAEHGADEVAEFIDGAWRDRGTIKFNHRVHMHPDGLRRLTDDGTYINTKLTCVDCHQRQDGKVEWTPIQFERHCAACHKTHLRLTLPELDHEQALSLIVPHEELTAVRASVFEKLSRYFDLKAAEDAAKKKTAAIGEGGRQAETSPAPLPGLKRSKPQSMAKDDWVKKQLEIAERQLLGRNTGVAQTSYGCRYCHQTQQVEHVVTILPARIPADWYLHSKFDHTKHLMTDCLACHQTATSSVTSKDIILPKMDNCLSCHTPNSISPTPGRSDCVVCHDYHRPHLELQVFDARAIVDYGKFLRL